MSDRTLADLRVLCDDMAALQAKKAKLEEEVKAINVDLDELRLREIPDLMVALEVKTATFENLGRVQLASDLYCSTVPGKKEEAMQWLRDMELGDMISETYNAISMKALVRRLIEAGSEVPDCLSVTPFVRASIVKA